MTVKLEYRSNRTLVPPYHNNSATQSKQNTSFQSELFSTNR